MGNICGILTLKDCISTFYAPISNSMLDIWQGEENIRRLHPKITNGIKRWFYGTKESVEMKLNDGHCSVLEIRAWGCWAQNLQEQQNSLDMAMLSHKWPGKSKMISTIRDRPWYALWVLNHLDLLQQEKVQSYQHI